MMSRIVWIFGAGLSKPLGGPLFTELFSPRFLAVAQGLAREEGQRQALADVSYAFNVLVGLEIVEDAEDFLSVLETACDDDDPQSLQCRGILRALGDGARQLGGDHYYDDTEKERQKLLRKARLQVALACDSFVPRETTANVPESWSFLRRWVNKFLEKQDTIITFNYDRAVEWVGRRRVWTLMPSAQEIEKEVELNEDAAVLLKLHGSVDWWRAPDGHVAQFDTTDLVQRSEMLDQSLVLGVPGPGKSGMATRELQPLWHRARQALWSADAVVIVGYSMPDTDGYAMELITEGLRGRIQRRGIAPLVHLVLGPDLNDPHKQRLRGYLEDVVGSENVEAHRAYAQGFFLTKEQRGLIAGTHG